MKTDIFNRTREGEAYSKNSNADLEAQIEKGSVVVLIERNGIPVVRWLAALVSCMAVPGMALPASQPVPGLTFSMPAAALVHPCTSRVTELEVDQTGG